jgi:hypothetical protein
VHGWELVSHHGEERGVVSVAWTTSIYMVFDEMLQ